MDDPIPQTGTSNPPAATSQSIYPDSAVVTESANNRAAQAAPEHQPDPADGEPPIHPADDNTTLAGEAFKLFEGQGRFGGAPERGPDGKFLAKNGAQSTEPTAPAQQPQQPAPQQNGYRDLSGLNAEDSMLFKNMSNAAFNKLKPLYLDYNRVVTELDTVKKQLTDNTGKHFYEQDNAYALTPEYQQLAGQVQQVDAEVSHWESQLEAIENGQPWSKLYQNPQTGQITLGDPQAVAPETLGQARAYITSKLSKGHGISAQYQQALGGFMEKFKGEHKSYVSKFDELEKQYFPGVDPKKLEAAIADKMKMFPAHMQNRREMKFTGALLALIDGFTTMLNQQRSNTATQQITQRTAASNGPAAAQFAPATNGSDTVGSIMAEFDRAKKSGWATP